MDSRQKKTQRWMRPLGPEQLAGRDATYSSSGEGTGQALEQPCEFIIATHARLAIANVVRAEGFEPSTYRVEVGSSIQLSYARLVGLLGLEPRTSGL